MRRLSPVGVICMLKWSMYSRAWFGVLLSAVLAGTAGCRERHEQPVAYAGPTLEDQALGITESPATATGFTIVACPGAR